MIDDTFTPERIARLRKAWSGEDPVSSAFCAALDAIENERMFNSDQEAQLRARNQRREQLLRECLAYVEPTGPSPSCQSLAAKIRDELEGGADATLS